MPIDRSEVSCPLDGCVCGMVRVRVPKKTLPHLAASGISAALCKGQTVKREQCEQCADAQEQVIHVPVDSPLRTQPERTPHISKATSSWTDVPQPDWCLESEPQKLRKLIQWSVSKKW